MASTINPNNINITYPIAGQDNDTQGFRDNFRNIKTNFNTAKLEITDLQSATDKAPQIKFQGNVTTANVAYPASSSAPGVRGQITWGPDPFAPTYLYVCVATGNGELGAGDTQPRWLRANLSTW